MRDKLKLPTAFTFLGDIAEVNGVKNGVKKDEVRGKNQ
jgi:hypothetical protein